MPFSIDTPLYKAIEPYLDYLSPAQFRTLSLIDEEAFWQSAEGGYIALCLQLIASCKVESDQLLTQVLDKSEELEKIHNEWEKENNKFQRRLPADLTTIELLWDQFMELRTEITELGTQYRTAYEKSVVEMTKMINLLAPSITFYLETFKEVGGKQLSSAELERFLDASNPNSHIETEEDTLLREWWQEYLQGIQLKYQEVTQLKKAIHHLLAHFPSWSSDLHLTTESSAWEEIAAIESLESLTISALQLRNSLRVVSTKEEQILLCQNIFFLRYRLYNESIPVHPTDFRYLSEQFVEGFNLNGHSNNIDYFIAKHFSLI